MFSSLWWSPVLTKDNSHYVILLAYPDSSLKYVIKALTMNIQTMYKWMFCPGFPHPFIRKLRPVVTPVVLILHLICAILLLNETRKYDLSLVTCHVASTNHLWCTALALYNRTCDVFNDLMKLYFLPRWTFLSIIMILSPVIALIFAYDHPLILLREGCSLGLKAPYTLRTVTLRSSVC